MNEWSRQPSNNQVQAYGQKLRDQAILSAPIIVAAIVAPVWAAWQLSASALAADPEFITRLDRSTTMLWLFLITAVVSIVLLKFTAPVLAAETAPEQPVVAAIWLAIWSGALISSSLPVILALPVLLPRFVNPIPAVILWIVLELIASLLPALLQHRASASRSSEPPGAAPAAMPATSDAIGPEALTRHPAGSEKLDLLMLLSDFAACGPGVYDGGVCVTDEGKIIARQSVLAGMSGMAQSTINRQLHRLHDAGRIALEIQGRQTRITVL